MSAVLAVALVGTTTTPATAARTTATGSDTTSATGSDEDGASSTSAPGEDTDPVAGEVTRIAGVPGSEGYSGDDGPATDARLSERFDVAVAPDGTTYLADRGNRRVRAIDVDGTITTVARALRSPDNDVDVAEGWTYSPSNIPISVDVADDGAVVVGGKYDISVLTPDGETTVIAGSGEDGLPEPGDSMAGDRVTIHEAVSVAAANDGTIYAYVGGIGQIISIDPSGQVRLVAGGGDLDSAEADGTAPATDYAIGEGLALTVADSGPFAGTVFFTAHVEAHVMAVQPDGTLDVVAGTGEAGFSGDGGPARSAMVSEWIEALAVSPEGDLLIGDTYNGAIRRVDGDGTITTARGAIGRLQSLDVRENGDIVLGLGATLLELTGGEQAGGAAPAEVATTPSGTDPYAQHQPGEVLHLAGADRDVPSLTVLQEDASTQYAGVAVDADGAVLFGDATTATVRRVEKDGSTSVVAGVWPPPEDAAGDSTSPETVTADEHVLDGVTDLATRPDGTVLIAEREHIWELHDDGTMTRVQEQGEGLSMVRGIATDATGAVYVTDGHLVRRIAPDGTAETIAGGGERWADDADGHPATEASLWEPADVAVDSAGNVYLTETGMPRVRRVDPDGVLTTVLGDSYHGSEEGGFAGDGGPGADAEVNTPHGLLVDQDDAVYVADSFNARVRRLDPDGTVMTVAGNGHQPGEQDAGARARDTALGEPASLAMDGEGGLVIATARPERVHRLTADGSLDLVADTSGDGLIDEEAPATDVPLPGMVDLAVAPDGTPGLGSYDAGVWTVEDSVSRSSTTSAFRIDASDGMYVTDRTTVSRILPDGGSVLLAGGGTQQATDEPVTALSLHLGEVRDLAAGPDDSVFVLSAPPDDFAETPTAVHWVTADGLATPVPVGDPGRLTAIATSTDGALYGVEADTGAVLQLDGEDAPRVVAARDEEHTIDLAEEPFGRASALPTASPQDLAVGPDGHLLLAVSAGVLVVDPVEDTYGFHGGLWPEGQHNIRVSADRHGNAYVLSHYADDTTARLSALVRPAEVEAPANVPWTGFLIGAGGLALLVGAWLMWRRRRTGLTVEE